MRNPGTLAFTHLIPLSGNGAQSWNIGVRTRGEAETQIILNHGAKKSETSIARLENPMNAMKSFGISEYSINSQRSDSISTVGAQRISVRYFDTPEQ